MFFLLQLRTLKRWLDFFLPQKIRKKKEQTVYKTVIDRDVDRQTKADKQTMFFFKQLQTNSTSNSFNKVIDQYSGHDIYVDCRPNVTKNSFQLKRRPLRQNSLFASIDKN